MQIKVIEEWKKDDLELNHFFSIPKNINDEISSKWFYLYEWIWSDDVKKSIERDFLKYIKKLGIPLALLIVAPSAIFLLIWVEALFFWYFFWFLWIINLIFIIFLIFLAIKRAKILSKNAYVLLTDNSVSINWEINKLNDFNLSKKREIWEIAKLFEEKIFQESNIEKTKAWFTKWVVDDIKSWYKSIMSIWRRWSRDVWKLVLAWLILYTIYVLSLWIIYFVWIVLISLFWVLLSIINKKIMLISWNQVMSINEKFESIDVYWKELVNEKQSLIKALEKWKQNNWDAVLITSINSSIEKINKKADFSVNTSLNLRNEIKSSKYNEMFNFSIYNSWIKRQIIEPLLEIKNLLLENLEVLTKTNDSIQFQIWESKDESHKWVLSLQNTRLNSQIKQISDNINGIDIYIKKLSS